MKKVWLAGLLVGASALAFAQAPIKIKAGMVSSIDQIALPIAVERGFFEKEGLDVTIVRPFATGVDALNALQAGDADLIQVGVPMIGAVLRGMDLVALGNYTGNSAKAGSDATLALIAGAGSGITKDLASLKGKKIAASFGTINHLYVLALLEKAGLTPQDVTLVNTPPPDMTVALLSKGVDAFACWDPVPLVALKDVPGAVEIARGGNLISSLGYNVGLRSWVDKNGATVEKFLAALAAADQWMRANPKPAAQVATRWISGLKPEVAEAAMQFNIQQSDRRLSANSYRAMWSAHDRLSRLGFIKGTLDVNKSFEPRYILNVMKSRPQLFSDMPAIPAQDAIAAGYAFKP